jgi:signal transduction histidine kinase
VSASRPLANLPAAVEVAAYRIAIEAVTNTVRHAEATCCTVGFSLTDDHLVVEVTDDGAGSPTDWTPGVGISAMRERVAEIGGTLTMVGAAGRTTVRARIPLGLDERRSPDR